MKTKRVRNEGWVESGYRGEFTCPHGVGHGMHIHGCDGCCSKDRENFKALWKARHGKGRKGAGKV